jgi:hypothetical protein
LGGCFAETSAKVVCIHRFVFYAAPVVVHVEFYIFYELFDEIFISFVEFGGLPWLHEKITE